MKLVNSIIIILSISISLAACAPQNALKLALNIQSAHYLNPDIHGRTSPVVINLYQLKNQHAFQHASYQQLVKHPGATLNDNLIDRERIEIQANHRENIKQYVSQQTHYLGVVAEFHDLTHSQWRTIIKIPNNKKSVELFIHINSQSIHARLEQHNNRWW